MSLSSHQEQEPTKLPQLAVSPIRPVPALQDKSKGKAPEPAKEPQPQPKDEPKQEIEAAAAPAKAEVKANKPTEEKPRKKAEEKAPALTPEERRKKRERWMNITLDTMLVCMVIGVLVGGSWYLKTQWDKYRVPTIMELAHTQCLELCAQRESLQDAANHADEQLHMRRKLTALENQLRQFSEQSAQLSASITEQQKRVLALQHEIRRADKEARSAARGLLPGLPIGDVTTTKGRVHNNATISRLEGKRITLRTPYGAASLPVSELVKDNLPDIVLYALGVMDLVDMSDFTASGAAPTTPQPKSSKLLTDRPRRSVVNVDYDPAPSAPVIDTKSNTPTTGAAGDGIPANPQTPAGDIWRAPIGDLPL